VLAFGGLNSGIFKALLVLHILSAIVGLGAVMLNGIYAAQGQKRPGAPGRAISEANFAVSQVAEKVIYLIPVFGILLVLASDHALEFSYTFVWLALALYIGALGVSHSILIPGHKKINALLLEMEQSAPPAGGPPPQVMQIQAIGKRQAAAGASLNVVVAVILILMIWKPI
jgi:Predicted integral membrane protein (DUF2269)